MSSAALHLAREDLRLLLRAKETWLWTFLMPLVFFYFFGTMMGGSSRPPGSTDRLVLDSGPGVLEDELALRLREQGFELVEEGGERGPAKRLLVPRDLTPAVLAGEQRLLELEGRSSGMAGEHDEVRVLRAAYTVLADLFVLSWEGREVDASAFAELRAAPRALELEVVPAGRRREVPRGFQQAVPGTLVMFTVLVLLTSGSSLIVIERRRGLLARLASAPLSRLEVVVGKLLGKLALGLAQIGYSLAIGSFVFGVDWAGQLPAVAVLLGVWGVFVSALGLLLGNLARTEGQAVGIGVLAANLLAALGGCWWPIEVTPDWMQSLAALLPTGWVMSGLHDLVAFGHGPSAVLPELAALTGATLVTLALAARTFRYQ